MNLARPSEFDGPGRWRMNNRPEATAARFASVAGNDGALVAPLATISMSCLSR